LSISPLRLAVLEASPSDIDFTKIKRGIEKESLRISKSGTLAQTSHPTQLGSALTHKHITTDFSEALLEFITSPTTDIHATLSELDHIHRFTYANLDQELLWVNSMPCALPADKDIPVARYGSAHIARMKTIYRLGLGHRYGRLMQTIAGIHFNFSLPDEFWSYLQNLEADTNKARRDLKSFRTQGYLHLIRNFRRYFWLLLYLFGASPAVCPTFVKGRQHVLQPFGTGNKSLHGPLATSLRMGDLGYQSTAQQSIAIDYNSLPNYLTALCGAITQPHKVYADIGLQDASGNYQQLNTGILQIENEFYSTVRPKRTSERGETALNALFERGIEYVEVRCVDLNPFEPLGISEEQMRFLDTFLLYCALADSPIADADENKRVRENQQRIVYSGRDPKLKLVNRDQERSFNQWAGHLLSELKPVAELLDRANNSDAYRLSLSRQQEKIADPNLTPSAQVLDTMSKEKLSFFEFGLYQAQQHNDYFRDHPLDANTQQGFVALATASLREQAAIEAKDNIDFETYLRNFYAQYQCCSGC
jgi:glutamate--cysteine ligase